MNAATSLGNARAFLIDLDGVVFRGNQILPGARELVDFLRRQSLRFCLITNNSTKTAGQFALKLQQLGIDVEPEVIVTSVEATAGYLSAVAALGTRVLVLGSEGLQYAIERVGFVVTSRRPDYVVVGLDARFTYQKLARAALAIRSGARFVATNRDATLPTEGGEVPGAGALVAALETATGVAPVVVGKPQPMLLEAAMQRIGAEPRTTAIVGDRVDTDILAGKRLGLCTVLVLSGVTARDGIAQSQVVPDFVFGDLRGFGQALAAARLTWPSRQEGV